MKKILLALAFIGCMFAAHAQEKPSTGDLYDGLTRPLTFNRVIPPYALEVTFSKTVHVIFPLQLPEYSSSVPRPSVTSIWGLRIFWRRKPTARKTCCV